MYEHIIDAMKKHIPILLLSLLCCSLRCFGQVAAWVDDTETLRGIKAMRVSAYFGENEDPTLTQDAVRRCQAAGITVVTTPHFLPKLYLHLERVADNSNAIGVNKAFAYMIEAEFIRSFQVGKQAIAATTYTVPTLLGHCGIMACPFQDKVSETVDLFLKDWRSVN